MAGRVACYSGGEYAERPRSFEWEGRRLEVAEVLASQRHPAGKTFRVRASGEGCFDLVYDQLGDEWEIVALFMDC